jgi:ABC-type phosphate transport system substrate-binding protein
MTMGTLRPRVSLTRILPGVMALALFVALAVTPVRTQGTPDIAVIVNPDVQVDNLTLADLRRILLGDREFWPSGVRVTLLIRAPIARERDAVVKDVCEMTEAQFRQHWIGKVFRNETPTGPKIVYSNEMALDQVSRLPGAIALVQASAANKNVKILKIDGKAPGQPGYKVR